MNSINTTDMFHLKVMWRRVRTTKNRRCSGTCYRLTLSRECSLSCEVLADKVIKKFPTFCPIVTPITVLTTARLYAMYWASLIHSILTIPFSYRYISTLPTHLQVGVRVFQSLVCILRLSFAFYVLFTSCPLSLLFSINCIWRLFLRVGCDKKVPAFDSSFWAVGS